MDKQKEGAYKQALSTMCILIDTREKENKHIVSWLDENNITYMSRKLDYGDYSFTVKIDNEEQTFENKIVVERKANLDELATNITTNRDRFVRELERSKDSKFILMIEKGNYSEILSMGYRSTVSPKCYIATLEALENRYNIAVKFVNKKISAQMIYAQFKYYLRNKFKEG